MRKGERTKKLIIEKATKLFNERGYVASTMVDVMKETGLERGGLYNHFKSKDELAIEAFQHATQTMGAKYKEVLLNSNKHIGDRLIEFIEVFSKLYKDTPIPGGCPIMKMAIETDVIHPTFKDEAKGAMVKLHLLIEQVICEGIERGEVKSQIHPNEITTLLLSTLEGALMLSRLEDDNKYLLRMIKFLKEYIINQVVNDSQIQ